MGYKHINILPNSRRRLEAAAKRLGSDEGLTVAELRIVRSDALAESRGIC
jgi:hypothetical protein